MSETPAADARGAPARDRADPPRARRHRRRALAQGGREGAGADQEGGGPGAGEREPGAARGRGRRRRGPVAPAAPAPETLTRGPPLVAGPQADRRGVQGGQPHRLGGGAHLLRGAGDLPGADRAGLDPRPRRRVRHAAADRQPRHGRARPRQGDLHERHREPPGRPGRRRRPVRGRPARRALVGVGLRGRVHARLQRDLRHRGGAADLEDAARARVAHARAAHAARHHDDRRGPHRRARRRRSATWSASATPP